MIFLRNFAEPSGWSRPSAVARHASWLVGSFGTCSPCVLAGHGSFGRCSPCIRAGHGSFGRCSPCVLAGRFLRNLLAMHPGWSVLSGIKTTPAWCRHRRCTMPTWAWVVIAVVALAIFIPFKIKMTKLFLNKRKSRDEENTIDE